MLKHAWENKFLDLTILQSFSQKKSCLEKLFFLSYNPFNNSYNEFHYHTKIDVFPNKLSNLYGYSLTAAVVERPPLVKIFRNDSGYPVMIDGPHYGYVEIISKSLNFSIKWLSPNVTAYVESIPEMQNQTILDLIIRGIADFGLNHIYLHLALIDPEKQGERSITTYVDDLCALVPVYRVPDWLINSSIIFVMLNIFGHVLAIWIFTVIFKFDKRIWRPHHILQVILGSATPRLPKKNFEKLFFIFLITLSVYYSSSMYARLSEISLRQFDDGPFHTLDDLERSDLRLEINPTYSNMTFLNCDKYPRLKTTIKPTGDYLNCPKRLRSDKKLGCLLERQIAEIKKAEQSRIHSSKMKVIKPCFWSAPQGCIFSEASPYVIEFNKIMRKIFEHALWMNWVHRKNERSRHASFFGVDGLKEIDGLLRKKLMVIWSAGCIISCVSFLCELITYYCNKWLS